MSALERWGRNALAPLLEKIFPVHKTSPEVLRRALETGEIKKILLIRPHQGLGDLLLASPIFRALKKSYPGAELHFLGDTYNSIAVRDNPHLTRLWSWDKKAMRSPRRSLSFLKQIRAEHFDLAIVVSSRVPSFTSFLLGRLSGARFLWAYDTQTFYGGANWSHYLADVVIPSPPETDPEWIKFMDLIRPLGVEGDYAPEFGIPETPAAWARERWRRYPSPSGRWKVGVFLGGNPDRQERLWPAQRWTELVKELERQPDIFLIAIVPPDSLRSGSGAAELGVYEEVSDRLGKKLPTFADQDLTRVAAFLQGLDVFVVVDGGLFHMAVASGVRTLGLFFMTDPARWMPPVSWAAVLRPSDDRPLSLSAEDVSRKVNDMLKLRQPAGTASV